MVRSRMDVGGRAYTLAQTLKVSVSHTRKQARLAENVPNLRPINGLPTVFQIQGALSMGRRFLSASMIDFANSTPWPEQHDGGGSNIED